MMDPDVQDEVEQQPNRSRANAFADAFTSDLDSPETPQLTGAMSHSVFGSLNGVYTLECEYLPSEEEILEALRLRVVRDCGRSRKRDCHTILTAWHGGWTCEGIGIFSAAICSTSTNERTRHLGRACVNVRTPTNSGSRTWNGVAC
jgi:hypothetical protein